MPATGDVAHDRDTTREPCPDRIIEDCGGAFGMGCVGGSIWHFISGLRNSPKGERFGGAVFSMQSRAPVLGGSFAVWGLTFSSCDCTLQWIRKRDDHWNSIAAGFLTGGILAARAGAKAAGRSAVVGGVILAAIEGVSGLMQRQWAQTPRDMHLAQMEAEKAQREYEKNNPDNGSQGFFGGMSGMFQPQQPMIHGGSGGGSFGAGGSSEFAQEEGLVSE